MKRILVAGMLAISIMAIAEQQASAWVNSKFGIGLNLDYQSGGNQILWGAWRNGQPPGPEAFNAGPYQPSYRGPVAPPGPYFGGAPMPQGSFDAQTFEPPYAGTYQAPATSPYQPPYAGMYQAPATSPYQTPYAGGYQSPFQFANYPRPVNYYYYYPAPTYYYYSR
jgi:hypothetical protein